jgi:hypothetical protein
LNAICLHDCYDSYDSAIYLPAVPRDKADIVFLSISVLLDFRTFVIVFMRGRIRKSRITVPIASHPSIRSMSAYIAQDCRQWFRRNAVNRTQSGSRVRSREEPSRPGAHRIRGDPVW